MTTEQEIMNLIINGPDPIYSKKDLKKDGTVKRKYKHFNRLPINYKSIPAYRFQNLINELIWKGDSNQIIIQGDNSKPFPDNIVR